MVIRTGRRYRHLIDSSSCVCCEPSLQKLTLAMNSDLSRRGFFVGAGAVLATAALFGMSSTAKAQAEMKATLFEDVRVFDGIADKLSAPSNVLIIGNTIKTISTAPIAVGEDLVLTRIAGNAGH